jgi:hypothetical protein
MPAANLANALNKPNASWDKLEIIYIYVWMHGTVQE